VTRQKVQPVEGASSNTSTYWSRSLLALLLVLVLVVVVVLSPSFLQASPCHPTRPLRSKREDDTACLVTESCRLSLVIVFS
jgi:hypothetical protein